MRNRKKGFIYWWQRMHGAAKLALICVSVLVTYGIILAVITFGFITFIKYFVPIVAFAGLWGAAIWAASEGEL